MPMKGRMCVPLRGSMPARVMPRKGLACVGACLRACVLRGCPLYARASRGMRTRVCVCAVWGWGPAGGPGEGGGGLPHCRVPSGTTRTSLPQPVTFKLAQRRCAVIAMRTLRGRLPRCRPGATVGETGGDNLPSTNETQPQESAPGTLQTARATELTKAASLPVAGLSGPVRSGY